MNWHKSIWKLGISRISGRGYRTCTFVPEWRGRVLINLKSNVWDSHFHTMSSSLPSEYKALVTEAKGKPVVKQVPFLEPGRGDVTVRMLATYVNPTSKKVLMDGDEFYPGPEFPFVWGWQAVGRVEVTGDDAIHVKKGDLVVIDNVLRGRDDKTTLAIQGLYHFPSEGSKQLLNLYKNAFYAEYATVPLENVHVMNEDVLLNHYGYKAEDLLQISRFAVSMGGLSRVKLQPGETIVIAPSTGGYSSDAVQLASAMGATVIAASRNKAILDKLAEMVPRVHALELSGDVEADAKAMQQWGTPDVFLDYTPQTTTVQSYTKSAIQAVKTGGRLCFLGVPQGNVEIPYATAVIKNLEFVFNLMHTSEDEEKVIRLVENGLLPLGKKAGQTVETFKLDEWEKAFTETAASKTWGKTSAFVF